MTTITQGAQAFLKCDLKRTAYGTMYGDFPSSALGSQKWYDGSYEAQLEILFAYVGQIEISLQCGDVEDGPKMYVQHSYKQISVLFRDLLSRKYKTGVQLATLCAEVHSATTQEELDAISWSPI